MEEFSHKKAPKSAPKLGGLPFARFLANGGVVPQENHSVITHSSV